MIIIRTKAQQTSAWLLSMLLGDVRQGMCHFIIFYRNFFVFTSFQVEIKRADK